MNKNSPPCGYGCATFNGDVKSQENYKSDAATFSLRQQIDIPYPKTTSIKVFSLLVPEGVAYAVLAGPPLNI